MGRADSRPLREHAIHGRPHRGADGDDVVLIRRGNAVGVASRRVCKFLCGYSARKRLSGDEPLDQGCAFSFLIEKAFQPDGKSDPGG